MKRDSRIVAQATSGRWILTVIAGVAFFAFCIATCMVIVSLRGKLEPATLVSMFGSLLLIVQGVYKDYFSRTDRNGKHPDENGQPPVEEPPVEQPPADGANG